MPNSHSITELEAEVADLKKRNGWLLGRLAKAPQGMLDERTRILALEAEVRDLKHRNAVLFERIAQQSRAAEAARGGR